MRKVLALSFVALLLVASLPTVAACETEAARIANGQLPSPTGISPNKDDSIRETVRISEIGQSVARTQLWMVVMGANLSERQIADEIDRAMIEMVLILIGLRLKRLLPLVLMALFLMEMLSMLVLDRNR